MMETVISNILMVLTLSPVMILIVEIMCTWFCKRRTYFYPRLVTSSVIYAIVSYLLLRWETSDYTFLFSLKIIAIFALSIALLFFCYHMRFKTAIFSLFTGYFFSNSHYYLTNILLQLAFKGERTVWFYLVSFIIMVFYLIGFWFLLVRRLKQFELESSINTFVILFAVACCLFIHIISLTIALPTGDGSLALNIYGALCSLSILLLLFSFCFRNKEEKEKEMVEDILNKSEQVEEEKKDLEQTIQLKAHDLKHQIGAIKQMAKMDEKDEELYSAFDETEEEVSRFDGLISSGNRALDVTVSERMETIRKLDIRFSYILDGKCIGFMKTADIYALFGNIIDNALEALEKEPVENRSLTLTLFTEGDYVLLHSDNACSQKVEFKKNMPITQKDHKVHGYGTQSIAFIAQKYGGTVKYTLLDDVFSVDINLPNNNF